MKTEQERLARMHRRARELQRRQDRSLLRIWGGVSMGLFLCLLGLTAAFSTGHGLAGEMLSASSLLSDSVGGYVLTGVLAFTLGVILTAELIRYRRKHPEKNGNDSSGKREETAE